MYVNDGTSCDEWFKFLEQLVHPEDIPTIQEYMGYCFIPTTKAQVMLMLIGNGGEMDLLFALVIVFMLIVIKWTNG